MLRYRARWDRGQQLPGRAEPCPHARDREAPL